MPITQDALESALRKGLPDATIAIIDLAGDNDHWAVELRSPVFAGKSRLAQHRLVQDAVADHNIHALSIKTGV